MRKIIFAIFAHPDDEAFGPSGTLLTEAKNGAELHLITLTAGGAGMNPDNLADLTASRLQEWKKGGQLMGASAMEYLGYQDGQLDNQAMLEISQRLVEHVSTILQSASPDCEVEFISNDLNGISGHIDHIVASRSACLAFYRLKSTDDRLTRIRLACLTRQQLPTANTDWLYMEAGRSRDEIDEVVDARQYYDEIVAIMRAHHSQRSDGEAHIAQRGRDIGLNYFMVKT